MKARPASSISVRPLWFSPSCGRYPTDRPDGFDDIAAVRLFEARQHLEQGRLAGAVGSAESDALAIVDLPADRVEQDAIAKGLAEPESWIMEEAEAPGPDAAANVQF